MTLRYQGCVLWDLKQVLLKKPLKHIMVTKMRLRMPSSTLTPFDYLLDMQISNLDILSVDSLYVFIMILVNLYLISVLIQEC
mmetsp:Transcript_13881/g.18216  ORF Transcript_13881/g.18216 Transcript_13881/m.18216 type:complete len:82 (-) Transcript_13881:237-482(-)